MAWVSEYIEPRSPDGSGAIRLLPGPLPRLSLSPHRVEPMVLHSSSESALPWSAAAVPSAPPAGRNTAVATAALSPNAAVRLSVWFPLGPMVSTDQG